MTRNVFECINWTRQEHLVALSALGTEAFWSALRASPPGPAAQWDLRGDKIALECVAKDMDVADARQFLESYVSALRIPGWKVHCLRED